MFFYFGLIFLLSGNALGLEVIRNEAAAFDHNIIQGVNKGSIKQRIGLPTFLQIFPGTLWCGNGNISTTPNDLGTAKETDKCCRTHDMCDDVIEAGETRHNLINNGFYSRLSCNCDLAFHNCLKKVNSFTSQEVGSLYFTALGTQCFRLDYPIKGCKKKEGFLDSRCLEHKFDTNGKKKYQWFDVPFF